MSIYLIYIYCSFSQFLDYTYIDKSQLIQISSGKEVPLYKLKEQHIIVLINQDMLISERKDT
jgi:hypothetical protein